MRSCFKLLLGLQILSFALTANSQTWSKKANFPGGGTDAGVSFALGGKLYFGGGAGAHVLFYQYDPATDKWTKKTNLPSPVDMRAFASSFTIGTKGYVALGQTDASTGQPSVSADLWEYDPDANKWSRKADFPGVARDGALCFGIEGYGYIGGGIDQNGFFLSDFFQYDPTQNVWNAKADLPKSSGFPMSFAIGSVGYMVVGGTPGKKQAIEDSSAYVYEPSTDTWTPIATFPGPAREAGVGFTIGNVGYVGLGESNYSQTYSDMYSYDRMQDKWTRVGDVPNANGIAWGAASVVADNVYMDGGASIIGPNLQYVPTSLLTFPNPPAAVILPQQSHPKVYPNPARGMMKFSVSGSIEIFDAIGREVLSGKAESLDVSGLPSGAYHYQIRSGGEARTGTFMKE